MKCPDDCTGCLCHLPSSTGACSHCETHDYPEGGLDKFLGQVGAGSAVDAIGKIKEKNKDVKTEKDQKWWED